MSDGGAQFIEIGPYFNSSGTLYQSIKVYHYAAGTTTNKDMWSDEGKISAVAQPFVGDTSGIAGLFGDGMYHLVIKDTDDNTLYDRDNWRITSDTATLWEGNFGTSYPTATAANLHHLFAKVDGSDNLVALGLNNGTSFIDVSTPIGQGTDIASAATITIPGDGWYYDVTGTMAITAINTYGVGRLIYLQFDGILTLTHNGTSLILPGGNNITTYTNLVVALMEISSGNWMLVGSNDKSVTLADFTNALHDHSDAANGGNLGAVTTGTITASGAVAVTGAITATTTIAATGNVSGVNLLTTAGGSTGAPTKHYIDNMISASAVFTQNGASPPTDEVTFNGALTGSGANFTLTFNTALANANYAILGGDAIGTNIVVNSATTTAVSFQYTGTGTTDRAYIVIVGGQ